jgi:ABC-type branched-subunit amino acid transport system ATPase component
MAGAGLRMTARLETLELRVRIGALVVLGGIDLAIAPGERVGLIGPNGSGKSTLFNAVTGLVPVAGGTVRLDGRDIANVPGHRIARAGVARTFQTPRVFRRMSVADNLRPSDAVIAETEIDGLLREAGLDIRREALAGDLTLAQLRRLEVARVLARRPRLVLLDEPTAGLTPSECADIVSRIGMLMPADAAVVVIEHRLDVLRDLTPRVVVLDHGVKIADGPMADVERDPAVHRVYTGAPDT